MVSTAYFKMRNIQFGYSLKPNKVFTRLRLFAMAEIYSGSRARII
jgi:hypothetical protein